MATDCTEVGTTLATLPVLAGHWRTSSTSVDIRECPARYDGSANLTKVSGCVGGAGSAPRPYCTSSSP